MSQENVESVKRGVDAYNRRDLEGVLAELDPEVEWHPAVLIPFEGEAVSRGHEGVREMLGDVFEAFAEIHTEYSEIRDLGDRVVAVGRLSARGRESGAEMELLVGSVTDFRDGKAIRVSTYLDHNEALEAAGLSE